MPNGGAELAAWPPTQAEFDQSMTAFMPGQAPPPPSNASQPAGQPSASAAPIGWGIPNNPIEMHIGEEPAKVLEMLTAHAEEVALAQAAQSSSAAAAASSASQPNAQSNASAKITTVDAPTADGFEDLGTIDQSEWLAFTGSMGPKGIFKAKARVRYAKGTTGMEFFVDGKKYKNTPPLPKKKKTKSSASAKAKMYAKPGQVMPNYASLRRGGGPAQSMRSMQKRHADKLRKLRQELVTAFAKNDADYAALPPFEADSDGE
jgi:hypothetical protein